jgi:hypothetical protein
VDRKKLFSGGVFLLVLLALLVTPTSVGANHSWGNYHWARTTSTFSLKLGDNVSGLWDGMLGISSADWSQSNKLDTTIVSGGTTGLVCQPTSGRVEVCSADYGGTGWLGLAQIWITRGSHIAQGVVKNNDYYFGNSSYQYNNTAEMQHVICQEIGHTFGLDHQSESGISLDTCMDYYHNTSDADSLSTHPNDHDYAQLSKIYKHKDRFSTVGATSISGAPAGFANADVHAQENWGQLVSTSANGRESLFVLDFGQGYRVFTWVTWVVE